MIATSARPLVMGIVNVTPDSFSDGGVYIEHDDAVAHAIALADDGADIVDIGGESTRPAGTEYGKGAQRVDEHEEIRRVIPVIEGLHNARPDVLISVDTMKPAVAERAIAVGASMINDVSAGRFDPAIWRVSAEAEVAYVLMHGHDPREVSRAGSHNHVDVSEYVRSFLRDRIELARAAGVATIVADIGIGFDKGFDDNVRLLRDHKSFLELGVPLLVGASRKAFIGKILGGIPAAERDVGTLAAHAVAVLNGASIVRVHDVRSTLQFLTVFAALLPEIVVN